MPRPIYLDHAATTPVRGEVLEAMMPFFGPRFGNPSSVHRWGREARVALDEARARLAACLGARADEITFTSGGTEADNLAILGAWQAAAGTARRAVVTTPIEHKAVLAAVHAAGAQGAEARMLPVDGAGRVSLEDFEAALGDDVAVCSVMWVNNEIGTIQGIPELAQAAAARGVPFHTDAVQAFGKVAIDAATQAFDLLAISGHKIGAPKGIGALYVRRGTALAPLLHGGSQERGRRAGTENVALAVGLAKAAELAVAERERECARLEQLRDAFETQLLERIPSAVVNGRGAARAPHVLNISVVGADSESLLMALDLAGVACSSGSACQSGSVTPSHVLSAIGVDPERGSSAIRFSLGALSTPEDLGHVALLFPALIRKARKLASISATWDLVDA
jgi:cysteine desulfurase